jgi:hypothetical protein
MVYKNGKTFSRRQIKTVLKYHFPTYQIGKSSPPGPMKNKNTSTLLIELCGGQSSE